MTELLDIISPLFVPANRPERFEKAAASGADAVILDLEDAVPVEAKQQARAALRSGFGSVLVLVRINGAETAWHDEDLSAVIALRPAAVIVPKAEDPDGLSRISHQLGPDTGVIALVETALGLARAQQIATAPGIARLAFGSIDFCADIGCAHTRDALLHARSTLVLASRLGGLPAPLDGVTTDINDPSVAKSDARHARELGFGGKLTIHPRQIDPIRTGFMPDEAEIAWAHKVLASGDGAAAVDGAMVDEPVRIRARSILARANPGS